MALDNIHNDYEHLVLQRLNDMIQVKFIDPDPDFLEDVACVALNQLPARYVRYDFDMVYYMTGKEREQIECEVHKAVTRRSGVCKPAPKCSGK